MESPLTSETLRIGKYYKWMNICVIVWLLAKGIGEAGSDDPDAAIAMFGLALIILLLNALVFLYSTTRLSLALGGNYRYLPLALLVAVIAPFVFLETPEAIAQASTLFLIISFVLLIAISWKTRKLLEARGVRMGLLGAKNISWLGKPKK